MDYNSRAVSFFADAFSKFKKDENRYTKNEDALKSLADTYLFAFDANRPNVIKKIVFIGMKM